jgi:peptide chain release factor 3
MDLNQEIHRRRTFAIVSHPDAGKTTLTEKLLLYGGAVQLAGSVTARKKERKTVSDWLEIERKRGISVSSTVLNFDYNGYRINLLDTPGHNDFSEDTYRVLTAVDSVIMVIDSGKGIQQQTRKLFEVCRRRNIPVVAFVNKLDRPALDTLAILDEIEQVLKISTYPMNWPLGSGVDFKGVWDRKTGLVHLFERTVGGAFKAPVATHGISDRVVRNLLDQNTYERICEEVAVVEEVGVKFNPDDILEGKITPVFFGSAANNFGIQLLLDGFIELSPPPAPRISVNKKIAPQNQKFSGFVFKIQANLDPLHRDRMAFIRIVSGKFTRDMPVVHVQSGKKLRLSNSNAIFGRERVSIDEAFPGDVIGMVGADYLSIGDTLSEDSDIIYDEIPGFPPECFAFLHNPLPSNHKRFQKGLDQLVQEGLVRCFEVANNARRTPLLAAVGPLQFDLVQFRLKNEYGTDSRVEMANWKLVRWLEKGCEIGAKCHFPNGVECARDKNGEMVLLFPGEWHLNYLISNNKEIRLTEFPATD